MTTKAVTDGSDVSEVASGVTLLDSIPSASALHWSPLPDFADGMRAGHRRHLPQPLIGATPESGGTCVVDVVTVGRGSIGGVALSADGRQLLVTNYGDDSVSVIDTGTGNVVRTVLGTDEPFAIATARRGGGRQAGRAYVSTASASFDSIVAVDIHTAEVVAAHPVALNVSDLVVDPTGQHVYVIRTAASGVDVVAVDADQGPVGTVEVSRAPGATATCVRISPDGRKLYAAVQRPSGDVVTLLDAGLNTVDTIEVGSTIRDVAVSPDGESLFIASYDPDLGEKVEVVGAHASVVHGGFAVGALVTRLTVSRDGDRLYVLTAEGIVVMCTRTEQVLDTIAMAGSPSGAVESPDGNHLYVADYAGSVTVVSVAALAAALSGRFIPDDVVGALLELEPAV